MNPTSRFNLMAAMIALAGMHSVVGGSYVDAPEPQYPPPSIYRNRKEAKSYRDRTRYRKRREWNGSRNETSLLDRARGAVSR